MYGRFVLTKPLAVLEPTAIRLLLLSLPEKKKDARKDLVLSSFFLSILPSYAPLAVSGLEIINYTSLINAP